MLVGHDGGKIAGEARKILNGGGKKGGALEFWDGNVSLRIAGELKKRKNYFMTPAEIRLAEGARF